MVSVEDERKQAENYKAEVGGASVCVGVARVSVLWVWPGYLFCGWSFIMFAAHHLCICVNRMFHCCVLTFLLCVFCIG